jgi:hypothetical protein
MRLHDRPASTFDHTFGIDTEEAHREVGWLGAQLVSSEAGIGASSALGGIGVHGGG